MKHSFLALLALSISTLSADSAPSSPAIKATKTLSQSFTGKVSGDRVRLRAQPHLDGKVIQEMNKGDLVLVKNENAGYYEIALPSHMKAYVFRTYVLDGVIEGTNVNVRLEPNLESPVIAQLNTGDKVEGTISKENSKWLEITPPKSASLFVASDYVEKIGNADYLARIEQQQAELQKQFQDTVYKSKSELQKPFNDIDFAALETSFNRVIQATNKSDHILHAQAKEALELVRDAYLQKKIAFLEEKVQGATAQRNTNREIETRFEKYSPKTEVTTSSQPSSERKKQLTHTELTDKMAVWQPIEEGYYERHKRGTHSSLQDFYTEEKSTASRLKGILESYTKPIKNKPGDYVLRDAQTHMPICYLYSTEINLDEFIGSEVAVKAAPRANHNFAFPAYFVHSVE